MKKRIVIVGGIGPGQIAASIFEDMNKVVDEWVVEGFLNDVVPIGDYFGKFKVLGGSEEVADFVNKGYYIHYAMHIRSCLKSVVHEDFCIYLDFLSRASCGRVTWNVYHRAYF